MAAVFVALLAMQAVFSWFASAVLWLGFTWAFVASLTLGAILIAGNRPKDSKPMGMFALGCGGTGLLHIGYFLGPFANGQSWWLWSFIPMLPLAALALLAGLSPFVWAMRWTRPDGASGWKTIRQMGWMTVIAVFLYSGPPIILWTNSPSSPTTAPSSPRLPSPETEAVASPPAPSPPAPR